MAIDKRTLYWERGRDLVERARMLFMDPASAATFRATIRQRAFATIEAERRWGAAVVSGGGSSVRSTAACRDILVEVVQRVGARSMLDVPCGDFGWMPLVLERLPDVAYVGGDIVGSLIRSHEARYPQHRFHHLDFVSDPLPVCDLIFCRDALQHLPVADIKQALANFSGSGASWLLASTHLRRAGWRNHRECRVGQCRDRNLMLPPFDLPDPVVVFAERDATHKFLGLWRLPFAPR